jgi:hypothetical protein
MPVRSASLAISCFICVACPTAIVWLGYNYGHDRLASDEEYRAWRSQAVDGLFWVAAASTLVAVAAASRRWVAAVVLVPVLCVTGVLAVTCGMWLDGTYF